DRAKVWLNDVLNTPPRDALSRGEYVQRLLMVAAEIARGLRTDWRPIYEGESPRRIRVPTYTFTTQRFWVDQAPGAQPEQAMMAADGAHAESGLPREIAYTLGEVLGIDPAAILPDHALSRYGLESIKALALKHALERRLGIRVPLELLQGESRIAEVGSALA